MIRLVLRTREEGIEHHRANPVRVYDDGGIQQIRIDKSRAMLARAVEEGSKSKVGNRKLKILELGCGTADISGPIAEQHEVIGVDCHAGAVAEATRRFPKGLFVTAGVDGPSVFAAGVDVLVLCEMLEHIADPLALVEKWLPLARASVISHPLDEPAGSGLSGGDHCWSFSESDFRTWFERGGHRVVESEVFEMGAYRIILGRGRRVG